MTHFLDSQTLDPLAYIGLTLRKLDCDVFNISQNDKKILVENLSDYIINQMISNGYGISSSLSKKLAKKYLWIYQQNEKKYYNIK